MTLTIDIAAQPRELAKSCLEIARAIAWPAANVEHALGLLDHVCAPPEGEEALGRGAEPTREALERLSARFVRLGFRANEEEYDSPDNSCLNVVLERRVGIPITLSILYMAMAERAGLEVRGVSAPSHFLCRCDMAAGPLFVDPYHRGRVMTELEALRFAQQFNPGARLTERSLLPANNREIVRRLLANLRASYLKRRRLDMLERTLAAATELFPEEQLHWIERGAALAGLGRRREASDIATRALMIGGADEFEDQRKHLLGLLRERHVGAN